jgi:5-methylcytosine-specific restriction endonuclease McrA
MSRKYVSRSLRERVATQAKHRCGYCLTQTLVVGAPMEIEHILPLALGGKTEEQNLWLACNLCNTTKNDRISAKDPQTNEEVPLFNPRQQVWAEHFKWNNTGEQIIGLTPTGRATIAALNLNRASLVMSRAFWVKADWHPPKD